METQWSSQYKRLHKDYLFACVHCHRHVAILICYLETCAHNMLRISRLEICSLVLGFAAVPRNGDRRRAVHHMAPLPLKKGHTPIHTMLYCFPLQRQIQTVVLAMCHAALPAFTTNQPLHRSSKVCGFASCMLSIQAAGGFSALDCWAYTSEACVVFCLSNTVQYILSPSAFLCYITCSQVSQHRERQLVLRVGHPHVHVGSRTLTNISMYSDCDWATGSTDRKS